MRRSALLAVILAASPALAQDTSSDNLLDRFLAANGQDIEGCFEDVPDVTDALRDPQFRTGGAEGPPTPRRMVIAFDASGSMAAALGAGTKMDGARDIVGSLLEGLPEDVTVGLVVFGHKGTNEEAGRIESCAGVETLARDEHGDSPVFRKEMAQLSPTGWTPLAEALVAAGAQMRASDTEGEQLVYVVSDGEETCGGDPVAAARILHDSEIKAVVNVLGLDLPPAERAQLEAVAEAGGGLFTPIDSGSDLQNRVEELERTNANAIEILRTRNQSNITQLTNRNATNIALLTLDNCIATRSLSERNRAAGFAREETLSPIMAGVFLDAVTELHRQYRGRAAGIRAEAEAALGAANTAIQDKMNTAEEEFDDTK